MKLRLNIRPVFQTISKFFYDILRDKNSKKFSITKALSLVFALYLVTYLAWYAFYLVKEVDHTLVIELIGLLITLLGLKNNWGVNSKTDNVGVPEKTDDINFEIKKLDQKDDAEPVF